MNVKVIYKKMQNGKDYESAEYYESEEDFKKRNPTLIFQTLTKKTKPKPKKKDEDEK